MLVEMSITVITTKGMKTAYAQMVKRIENESGGWLTMAAQMNVMRTGVLRSQMAHVLKANITGFIRVSGGNFRAKKLSSYVRTRLWQEHGDLNSEVKEM